MTEFQSPVPVRRRMEPRLDGQVVIVTGGARGIGRAITLALAEEGAEVSVFDLDGEAAGPVKELVAAVERAGGTCMYQRVDVTSSADVARGVEATLGRFRRIDALVNNAGGGMRPVALEDLEENDWERVIRLNLTGTYLCSRAVIMSMKAQQRGRIVNISSQGGRYKSEMSNLTYASAKAGVLGFTRQLAHELGPQGITVNAIAPGLIMSGERVAAAWEARSEDERRERIEAIPLRRQGRPEEIARVVVFLASEDSSYITGATIDVNGGRHMA